MTLEAVDHARALEARGLVVLLEKILAGVVNAYDQAGISLPDRRYWTFSTPAADCEQLVVSFAQAYYGIPGDEAASPQRCDSPRSVAVDVQILRRIPVQGARGRTPTAEEIQSHSEQLGIDAWMLLDIAGELDFWGDPAPIGLGVIATVDAGEAQGGYQGSTLHLTTALP